MGSNASDKETLATSAGQLSSGETPRKDTPEVSAIPDIAGNVSHKGEASGKNIDSHPRSDAENSQKSSAESKVNTSDAKADSSDAEMERQKKIKLLEFVRKELHKARTYTPRVGVFGVTGVGKSSLCNALFGRDVAKISDVAACTRSPQEIMIGDAANGGLILVDVPGVGENEARDIEYIELYKSLMPEMDLVLWAIKADDRAYSSAVRAYKSAVKPHAGKCPVVFVITHTDKIEPFREWDLENNRPGDKQLQNITLKEHEISKEFDVPVSSVVPVSAHEHYNLDALVARVVEVLPNEKKVSFTREAREENVTPETIAVAETGLMDYVVEKLGDAADYIRHELVDMATEAIKNHMPKVVTTVATAFSGWFKKRWPW